MKKVNKYLNLIICFIVLFCIINLNVKAASFNSSLSVSSSTVQPNDTFDVYLNLSNISSPGLGSIQYDLSYDANFVEYVSYSGNTFDVNNLNGILRLAFTEFTSSLGGPLNNSSHVIKFKAKTNGTVRFELTSAGGRNTTSNGGAGGSITSTNSGTSITIRAKSNEARLQSLTITTNKVGFNDFRFNQDQLEYNLTTTEDEVFIEALPAPYGYISSSEGAKFSKKLKYGANIIQIYSKAEDNYTTKVYTLTINRVDTRDKDATLASIEGVNNFKKDVYSYNITLPTYQGIFNVVATPTMISSKVEYSGIPTLNLDYGETKSIRITVTAQNGNVCTYTLNVTRKDDRDGNSFLKSLSVTPGNMTFNKDNYSYRIVVDNDVKEIAIGATPESNKTLVDGVGKKPLAVGSNLFRVTSTAENGQQKIYTITIIRKDKNNDPNKLSRNTKVTSLRLNGNEIQLKDNIYAYAISVENDVTVADFRCDLEDPKAMALLEGDRNLKVGVNKFKVTVTAENGDSIYYDIIVERQELRKLVQNTKEDILNTIRNSSEAVINVTVPHTDMNRVIDPEILSALKSTGKTIIYQVLNENNGLNYSFTINSSNINEIASFDFDLKLKSENKDKIDALSNVKKTVYVDLKDSDFKGKMSFKIYVGDKFDVTNTLTLLYYDKDNNSLVEAQTDLKVKNNYVEVDIDKFSEFILIDKNLVNSGSSIDGGSMASIGIIALVVVIIIIVIIIVKKKR